MRIDFKEVSMMDKDYIVCGNCAELMKELPDNCIDLTITSPPYDNLRNYKGYEFEAIPIINQLYRITKPGGVVVWVVNDATINGSETGTSFNQAINFMKIGFNLHDTMIYKKHNPTPNHGKRYQQSFEYMFVFSKGKPKCTNIMLRDRRNECNDKRTHRIKRINRSINGEFNKAKQYTVKEKVPMDNIWEYKVGLYNSTSDKYAFRHPAIFPEKLAQDHILSWSNPGDIVFDPMAGSGTVLKMAKLNGRHYIGMEISEEYFHISKRRVDDVMMLR